jgi:MOSC domain-containing protein YiiM
VTGARLLSVNVVHALIPDGSPLRRTAIDKRPVDGRIPVQRLGVAGDTQCDIPDHGGPDKAVYAYAREDTDWWSAHLGRELTNGQFGENLTTAGLDVTGALIGERWRIGTDGLEVEVTMPRIPCSTFQRFLGEPQWVKRFFAHGAPGAYLRVTSEGTAASGDPIEVVHRPDHGVSLGEVFVPREVDPARLRRLLDQTGLADDLVQAVRTSLAATG